LPENNESAYPFSAFDGSFFSGGAGGVQGADVRIARTCPTEIRTVHFSSRNLADMVGFPPAACGGKMTWSVFFPQPAARKMT
jgi:hypothetical protein